MRRRVLLGLGALLLAALPGCRLGWETIDYAAVHEARVGLEEFRRLYPEVARQEEEEIEEPEASTGSVILGELLAIFPGFFVHGLGHYYAGDYRTARRLRHIGEMGYLLTAVGGGLVVGGYYLDQEDDIWSGYAYSLYGTGGLVGGVGVFYFLTAWFYDMIDTPRAVETGGRPPPRSAFVEAMDVFE